MSELPQAGTGYMLDRHRELDELVLKAVCSEVFDEGEKEVLRVIGGHKGALNAIRGKDIADELHLVWGDDTRRWISGIVESAILVCKIPIGGLRVKPYGYFLIATHNDLELAIAPLEGEFRAMLRRIRALTGRKSVAELFGQEMLNLDEGEGKEAA